MDSFLKLVNGVPKTTAATGSGGGGGIPTAWASAGFQNFIAVSYLSAVNGSPSTGQFRSDIYNRSSIQNLTSDLKVRMGVERLPLHQIVEVPTELGPSGQRVFGILNDTQNQVRFVGSWNDGLPQISTTTSGMYMRAGANTTDYIEVVFWGNALNILTVNDAAYNAVASVDGGAEGANFMPDGDAVTTGRNVPVFHVVNVVSGLSTGLHTVKIRNNDATNRLLVQGFEFVCTSALSVNAGTAYIDGEAVAYAGGTVSYNSGFESGTLGTKGGRAVIYLKSDGTIGKAVTPTNTSAAYLTSTDHSNEEIIREYFPREFGANRSDDFSNMLPTVSADRAFTLSDGVTCLIGKNTSASSSGTIDGIRFGNVSGDFIEIQFNGTGLDIWRRDDGTGTDTYPVSVDGNASVGNLSSSGSTSDRLERICSGLPYGTHKIRITRSTTAAFRVILTRFVVYGPKKPSVPAGAVELAKYFILANYAANSTAGTSTIATGVIRKNNMREITFDGTWGTTPNIVMSYPTGIQVGSGSVAASITFHYVGEGFEFRFSNNSTSCDIQITVDGSTNLSSYTTATYGAGISSFTASTGTIVTSTTTTQGNGVRITGLSYGLHKIKIQRTSASSSGTFYPDAFDIIAGINTFEVSNYVTNGNLQTYQTISDTRNLKPLKISEPNEKMMVKLSSFSGNISVNQSTFMQVGDMYLPFFKKEDGYVSLSFTVTASNGTDYNVFRLYLDGAPLQTLNAINPPSGSGQNATASVKVFVKAGYHIFNVFARANSGTMTVYADANNDRTCEVVEI